MSTASEPLTTNLCDPPDNSAVADAPALSGKRPDNDHGLAVSRDTSLAQSGRQPLNAMDRFELAVHDVLRSVGHAGHFQQTLAWLDGRINEATLREAVDRLALCYPIVNARLCRSGNKPYWQFQPAGETPVEIVHLPDDEDAAVWRQAESLLATPRDLERSAPITFHLLRRPAAPDVLVLQWAHSLMDGKSGESVLYELNRLRAEHPNTLAGSAPLVDDEIQAQVRRNTWRRRWTALFNLRHNRLREPVKMLVDPKCTQWMVEPIRIIGRTLTTDDTARILNRSQRLFRYTNPTPVLLAGVFRAAEHVSPGFAGQPTLYRTLVPVNLRPSRGLRPIFRNLISYITFLAETDELADRDGLARLLHDRMRDQIRHRSDLGMLMTVLISDHFPRLVRRRLRNNPAGAVSLAFGYHGEAPQDLQQVCGAGLDRLFTLTSIASPPGFAISITLHQGRLNIGVSYIASSIPEERATRFLEAMLDDLLA